MRDSVSNNLGRGRGRTLLAAFMVAAVASGGPAAQTAPDAETHKAWMNDATDQQDELREALVAKSGAKAATAGKKLATLMGHIESYWDRKKATDAVLIARQARSLASETAATASRGKFVQAKAAFDKLSASCNACHDLHPEKR